MSIVDSLRLPDAPPGLADLEYRVGRLRLEPGDVLVLKVHVRLTDSLEQRIRIGIADRFPNTPVMILDTHADVSVLTRAEIEARTA